MTNLEKLEMTRPLRDFVDNWFFDFLCANYNSQKEFINRVWGLYNHTNDDDVDKCVRAANNNGFIVYHTVKDVRNFLANCACDVIFELYEDNELPIDYAEQFELDLTNEAIAE